MDSFKVKGENVSQLISCDYTLFSVKHAVLPSSGCRRLSDLCLPCHTVVPATKYSSPSVQPASPPPSVTSNCNTLVETSLQI